MKKMNLNDTWKLCLQMWKWIAAEVEKAVKEERVWDVYDLKEMWLQKHGFKDVSENCFFCEYKDKREKGCALCPGGKVDPDFDCQDYCDHYRYEPIAFYNKIRALNKKRQGKK